MELGTPRRIKNIFDSNINSAYAAGRYKEQMEEIDVAPYLQYMTVEDERTRPEHRALHGKIFRADDPFWSNFYPPNGWGCRCFVRNLTAREVEQKGLNVENTEGRISFINKKVGSDTKQIPVYKYDDNGNVRTLIPDAGWETNVGKSSWGIDITAWNKVKDLDETVKYKFISKMAENPHNKTAFEYFIDRVVQDGFKTGREDKTVTWLSAEVFAALNRQKITPVSPVVVCKDNEIPHIIGERKKMSAKELKKAYDVLNNPDAVYFDYTQKDTRLAFVKDIPNSDNCMKVCVKFDQKIERNIKENGNKEKTSKIINTVSTVGIVRKTDMNDIKHYKKVYIRKE